MQYNKRRIALHHSAERHANWRDQAIRYGNRTSKPEYTYVRAHVRSRHANGPSPLTDILTVVMLFAMVLGVLYL